MTKDDSKGETIRLWGLGTVRTLRPLWVLLELGLPFEHEEILTRTPSMETETFRAVSPRGKIPILDDGDLRLGESAAICLHLADAYRDRRVLAPEPGSRDRARHDELCWFAMTELDAILYTIRRHEGLPQIYGASEVAVEAARQYVARSATEIARRLADGRPFLMGEDFTIADVLTKSCVHWANPVCGIDLPEVVLQYSERISHRPTFGEAMKRNFTPAAMAALAASPPMETTP